MALLVQKYYCAFKLLGPYLEFHIEEKIMKKIIVILLAVFSVQAFARTGTMADVTVTKLITADSRFGGCMAMLSKPISTVLSGCPDNWVTFACDGSLNNSVSRAMMKWENAKLAYALGTKALLIVDDARKVNGYCYADIFRLEEK